MRRLKLIRAFLRGELIIIKVDGNSMTVDAGKRDRQEMQHIATSLFKTVYQLNNKT